MDSLGRTRARLGMAASGLTAGGGRASVADPSFSNPYLCFMDAQGKRRLMLFLGDTKYRGGVDRGQPSLYFLAADSSRPLVQFDVQHDKTALRLRDDPRGPYLFVAPFERVGEQITEMAEHVDALAKQVATLKNEARGQDAE